MIDSYTKAEALYSDFGIVLMGDVNRLKTSSISRLFKLKQLVKFPTRGRRTLDVILTNTRILEFRDFAEFQFPLSIYKICNTLHVFIAQSKIH